MIKKLDKISQNIYLSILCATNYPEQQPEYKEAKAYHLLWLLVPIVGIPMFIGIIGEK